MINLRLAPLSSDPNGFPVRRDSSVICPIRYGCWMQFSNLWAQSDFWLPTYSYPRRGEPTKLVGQSSWGLSPKTNYNILHKDALWRKVDALPSLYPLFPIHIPSWSVELCVSWYTCLPFQKAIYCGIALTKSFYFLIEEGTYPNTSGTKGELPIGNRGFSVHASIAGCLAGHDRSEKQLHSSAGMRFVACQR